VTGHKSETLLKNNKIKKSWRCDSRGRGLAWKHKDLSLSLSTTTKKKKKEFFFAQIKFVC
jgi:hypothetical protein